MRKGNYINTYMKVKFWPLDPKVEEVKAEDISHALSFLCRANGHYKHFYSVAQHSLNCVYEVQSRNLSKRIQLACLLHDASEAYISDIARPVKKELHDYLEIESNLQSTIYKRFKLDNLNSDEMKAVEEIDDLILDYELKLLLLDETFDETEISSNLNFSRKSIEQVELEFLCIYNDLSNNLNEE